MTKHIDDGQSERPERLSIDGGLWIPSPKQAAVLEAATHPEYKTIKAICKAAGVNTKSIWRWWNDDEGFRDAWNNQWTKLVERYANIMMSAQVRKANRGDTRAFLAAMEVAGKMIRKIDVTSKGEAIRLIAVDNEKV